MHSVKKAKIGGRRIISTTYLEDNVKQAVRRHDEAIDAMQRAKSEAYDARMELFSALIHGGNFDLLTINTAKLRRLNFNDND